MQSSAAYFQKSLLFNLYQFILYPLDKICQPWADINHESVPIHLPTITQFFILANRLDAISQIWLTHFLRRHEVTKTWMILWRETYHQMTMLSVNTFNLRWEGSKEDISRDFLRVDASLQALMIWN